MQQALALATESTGRLDEYNGGRLLNYHVQPWPPNSVGTMRAVQAHGLERLSDRNLGGGVRAMLHLDARNEFYICAGSRLWRMTEAGETTELGSVTDDRATTMATDGLSVMIVADGQMYRCDVATGALSLQPVAPLSRVGSVTFIDNLFVAEGVSETGRRRDTIAHSAPLDGSTWPADAFAVAESDPDETRRVIAAGGEQLWALGSRTCEVYYNAGTTPFAFARHPGGVVSQGVAATEAVEELLGAVYWVGPDGMVYTSGGAFQAQQIGTPATSDAFVAAARARSGLRMTKWRQGSDDLIAVVLDDEPSWIYATTTGRWSERNTGVDEGAWLGRVAEQGALFNAVGGADGWVYRMSGDVYADGDHTMRRIVSMTPIMDAMGEFTVDEMRVQLPSAAGGTVQVRTSMDGRTWTTWVGRDIGTVGRYRQIVKWVGLGRFEERFQAQVAVTDPIQADMFGGNLVVRQ